MLRGANEDELKNLKITGQTEDKESGHLDASLPHCSSGSCRVSKRRYILIGTPNLKIAGMQREHMLGVDLLVA